MEWKTVKIGDIGKVVTGKTPRTSIAENYGGNIPFLTPSDDLALKFAPVTNKTLTEQGVREVKNCLIPANSVCVSCIGSDLGKVVMNREPLVTNQQINSILPHENVDAHFIYYAMIEIGKHLNHLSKTSTAVPIINKSTFCNTELRLPPLETQRRIAAILSSFDDKIENNNRINRNLEAQAQALFKSWFVDFEPFGGAMPEDWKEGVLSDIAEITMGQSPRGDSYNTEGEGVIFYQGCSDFGDRFPSVRMYTTEPSRYAVPNSILMSVRAPVGAMNVAIEECCIGRGLASLKEKNGFDSYLLYLIKSLFSVFDSYNGDGTVFGSINKKSIGNIKVFIPSIASIESFHKIVSPLDEEIKSNYRESQRLAALRDTLLPKLMKGEIAL